MKDVSFLKIEISAENHVLVSGDPKAYEIIRSDDYVPFEEYVAPEYRECFLKNISEADDSWFSAKILSDNGSFLYYVRALRKPGSDIIRLYLVSIDELLNTHNDLVKTASTYMAQLALFDDVFFKYDPAKETVDVFNTASTSFDAGTYSLEDFEKLLCYNVTGENLELVKKFIGQIRSKNGRFQIRVDANLLNKDTAVTATVLEGSYIYYYQGTEGVVGRIHTDSYKSYLPYSGIRHDSLTGLVDKADITRLAQERIDEKKLEGTTLTVLDIDYFKNINDTMGHQFGDTVLKRIADVISTEIGSNGVAGRFGGDEFLIIFYNIKNEDDLRAHFKNIKLMVQTTISEKLTGENSRLSVSIGAATYPHDGDSYEDLFTVADHCLYIAKEKGRNRYIIYDPEKHGTLEDIRSGLMTKKKFGSRETLSFGDILVKMYDATVYGEGSTPGQMLDEFAESFGLQRITLFAGTPFEPVYSSGSDRFIPSDKPNFMVGMLNSDIKDKYFADRNFIVVNRVDNLPPQAGKMKDILKQAGIFSYIIIRFRDADDKESILVLTSLGKYTQWNESHFKYFRAFADILSKYPLAPKSDTP